jgi:undecaprenyl diphosphate synthase
MHIAFIMDGNGRWALRNGLTRAQGHEKGIEAANEIMMACVKQGIARATFYAFSVQNWSRERSEIENIYTAGKALFERMRPWIKDHNVVLKVVGAKFNLHKDPRVQTEIDREENPTVKAALDLGRSLIAETAKNTGTVITLCVSYGGREEILDVFRSIKEPLESLTTTMVSDFFEIPDVDLVIRTSGEYRISNFLLWQSAYAEYYFSPLMWPEFTEQELNKALQSFKTRDRRFGAITKSSLQDPEDLKTIYAELFEEPTEAHVETDLAALYRTLRLTHAFKVPDRQTTEQELRLVYQDSTPASVGATNILLDLYDLDPRQQAGALALLGRAFTIESLDHVFQKSCRLSYMDTTSQEKQILQTICQLQQDPTFLNRILSVYYGLKLYAKHLVHDDALLLYAPLLMICGDIVERRFEPYFDREDLKSRAFQLVKEIQALEDKVPKEVRDLLTFSSLAILFHYFEEPNGTLPRTALELGAYLISELKVLAAKRFIEENK